MKNEKVLRRAHDKLTVKNENSGKFAGERAGRATHLTLSAVMGGIALAAFLGLSVPLSAAVNVRMDADRGGVESSGYETVRNSAAVRRAKTDTLPGDILAPWEGGPVYYSRWSNGPSDDPDFFPIAVWLQSPENRTTATEYKRIGINTHIGLWEGPTEAQLIALTSLSTTVICDQNAVGLNSTRNGVITAWAHPDEPDNAQDGTQDPVPAGEIVDRYNEMKGIDPSRPVYLNFGQGAACDSWYGRGNRTNHPEDYAAYANGADIVSFDVYPMNVFPLPNSSAPWFRAFHDSVAQNLRYVADGVDRLRKWTRYGKPVWAWIECTNINGDSRYALTPTHVKAEAWMAIIHGAGGIGYFCHQFSPAFIEAGLLAEPRMREAVSEVNNRVAALALVLNTQSAANGVDALSDDPDVPVDAMVKRSGGFTYLFTVATRPGGTAATFTLRGFAGVSPVEAVGEGRTLSATDGVFRDAFSNHEVHIYKIPNPGQTGPDDGNLPIRQGLRQNYPNPFNRSTVIQYSVAGRQRAEPVKLAVCDMTGAEVAVLVNSEQSDGNYRVEFSPERFGLSSGVFICDLRVGASSTRKKMLYLR